MTDVISLLSLDMSCHNKMKKKTKEQKFVCEKDRERADIDPKTVILHRETDTDSQTQRERKG